jgi:host factor-I protein
MAIQNNFFNQLRKRKIPVVIFLVNGTKLEGKVESFDQYTVVINGRGKQSLLFKHAISTVITSERVDYMDKESPETQK